MTSIITELVNIFVQSEVSRRTSPGAGFSRCIEDLLVLFVPVVSLTHSPFPF